MATKKRTPKRDEARTTAVEKLINLCGDGTDPLGQACDMISYLKSMSVEERQSWLHIMHTDPVATDTLVRTIILATQLAVHEYTMREDALLG